MSQHMPSVADTSTPARILSIHISSIAEAFWWNIDALLEVTDAAVPEITKLDSLDESLSVVMNMMSSLSEGSMGKVRNAFAKAESISSETSDGEAPSLMEFMWDEVKSETWGPAFIMRLHETLQRPPRLPIFLQSTTVSAVSNFEVLFSRLVAEYYSFIPQALEAASREKEKEFSLKELKEMESLNDAIEIAIRRRVDELMFGSFSEWRKFFADKMNLKFEDYAVDWEFLQEVFQRRHVIVHNGGMVSRRYLRNVAQKYSTDVKEGDLLPVDHEYVVRAASELLAFGFLLAIATGIKLAKTEAEFLNGKLHMFTYRNLKKSRYRIVEKCATFGEILAQDMDDELIYRVNKWIARQRMGDESVRPEVEDWDVRALSSRYKLAKYCLLGENEPAMTIVESLYSTGDLSFEDIIEWPLLQPLRGTDSYVALTRRMEIPEGWHLSEVILYENPNSGTLHLRRCPLVRDDFKRKTVDQVDPESAILCKRCKPVLTR
ncbi:hypothetical protein [Streptomyces sp. NBC_00696]|uniref:hypothetical protein n=1 Tax=Streptomyces sp. NBC_00696 TaxID=2903672 RepID=UPI002E37700B|nr:hypothetical protein [Streptomyces sp. NBC_00696]